MTDPACNDQRTAPTRAGWYYVVELGGEIGARYYDDSDGTWWHTTRADGWTPNNSFAYWLSLPGVSDKQ